MSTFRDSTYKLGGWAATVYDRVHDNASDCLRGGFSLDDEIDIGGHCIDRPHIQPAGSTTYHPWNHYGAWAVIG